MLFMYNNTVVFSLVLIHFVYELPLLKRSDQSKTHQYKINDGKTELN